MKSLYKIVHTAAGSQWEEPEKRILDESLWMQGQGHQIVIIAPGDSPLLTRAKAVGLSTYPLSFRGLTLASQAHQLRKILENEQPNILNAHGRTDGRISLKAAQKAGVPCRIISCHSAKPLRNSLKNRHLYKKLSHYVFTDSDQATQRLKAIFKLKDMEIFSIPGGIQPPRTLGTQDEARREMVDCLGIEKESRFIGLLEPCESRLAISHIAPVLKAMGQKSMNASFHLLIPGSTDSAWKLLQQSVDRLGLSERVHLIEAKNRWDYYRALSCGIQIPSRRFGGESIPRPILEAMYASCPVVAAKTEGISEVLVNEKTGLSWDPNAPDQISDAVVNTLTREDEAKKRAEAARALVEKRFTIDTMGRDIIRIYRLHQVRLERRYHKVEPDLY